MGDLLDSEAYLQQLRSVFQSFRQQNVLCDTTLVTSDMELSAHSIVLAAASPVFESALRSCTYNAITGYRLEVFGVDSAHMELVLQLIYAGSTRDVENINNEMMDALVALCSSFGLDWLKSELDRVNSDYHCQPVAAVADLECQADFVSILDQMEQQNLQKPIHLFSNIKHEILHKTTTHQIDDLPASAAVYVCDICQDSWSTADELCTHRSRHRGCVVCAECKHCFPTKYILQLHSLAQCSARLVTCNICRELCHGFNKLEEHVAINHAASIRCSDCHQPFGSLSDLHTHRKIHGLGDARKYKPQFNSPYEVYQNNGSNANWVPDEIEFECGVCDEVFDSISAVEEHMLAVHDACETTLCSICGLSFSSPGNFHAHVKTHSVNAEPGKFVCTECGRSFSHSSHLTNHRRSHDPERPYVCNICGRTFKDNCLQKHMLTHQRIGRLQCTECPKSFARLADLNVHRLCHTGEMKHCCDICHRVFRKKNTLVRHLRVHTQERPYVCETCGKSFKILFHLRLHESTHSSDRPHSCEVCGKSFCSAIRLRKHSVIHTGIKPFSCPICRRTFNRNANMRTHLRVHEDRAGGTVLPGGVTLNDGSEFQCILCQEKFPDMSSLRTHLQLHSQSQDIELNSDCIKEELASMDTIEVMYCKMDDQVDTYIALPVVHLSEADGDNSQILC